MRRGIAIPCLIVALAAACGKKGPPLPPILRIPAAPADMLAERRADQVQLHFTVPGANTDGTRPANIQRIDVYALTSAQLVSVEQLIKDGTAIASVPVKGPRDPNDIIGPDDPAEDLEPLEGTGLDQGSRSSVVEELSALAPASGSEPQLRLYAAVGVSRNGRRGLLSPVLPVRLAAAPGAPDGLTVAYSETEVTVTWPPQESPAIGYHVYEVGQGGESKPASAAARLTADPIQQPPFIDTRIDWGPSGVFP